MNLLLESPTNSANPKWLLIGFGLVIGSIVLSWLAAIVLGGFKIGSLERRVAHQISREEYAAFWERMRQRLLQIGFTTGLQAGLFLQSGAEFGNMSSFTHAKTKKEFRATAFDNGAGVTVELSLRYLDPIVGDSGESAYRDSVLDFVSRNTDEMRTVSNRSFTALSSLIGGGVACASLVVMQLIGFNPILPPILVLAVTYVLTAIMAIVTIRSKPAELTGVWLAIAGIGLGVIAIIGALVLQVRAAF